MNYISHLFYRSDPLLKKKEEQKDSEAFWKKCKRISLATISVLSLYPPLKKPFSTGTKCLFLVLDSYDLAIMVKEKNIKDQASSLFFAFLSIVKTLLILLAAPQISLLSSLLISICLTSRELSKQISKGATQKILENCFFLTMDLLALVVLSVESTLILTITTLLSILYSCYSIGKLCYKGYYYEATCKTIVTGYKIQKELTKKKEILIKQS